MSWSANEGGPTPDDVTGDGEISPVNANEMQRLQELIKKKKGLRVENNKSAATIKQKTERVVTDPENFITKIGEFRYANKKPVKAGLNYHIHYTIDMNEVYMSGINHDDMTSRIIYPMRAKTDFRYYNSLNRQGKLTLKPKITEPNEKDYSKKYFFRYFAKKVNDLNSIVIEISKDSFNKSPLYNYVRIKWHLAGKEEDVLLKNRTELLVNSKNIPNLYKAANPLQYYRYDKNLNVKDSILSRLENSTSNTESTETSTEAVGWSANDGGPPPGY